MATKAAEKLLPLLSRFAEKKLEHPKDSLRISTEHFEMVKSRSDKKFEHRNLPKGKMSEWVILPDNSPKPAEQIQKIADTLQGRLPDLPPTDDPLLARLRAIQPDRKKEGP